VEKFKLAGWVPDEKKNVNVGDSKVDTGQATTTSIVEKSVGGKVTAVLMKIPNELYEEDQKAKQMEVNKLEEAMKRDARQKADYGKLDVERRKET
jgi:hypothetical protein